MGAKLYIKAPGMRAKFVRKIKMFDLFENAWFPWEPITESGMSVHI